MNEWLLFFHVLFAVVWLGGAVYVEGLMATANRTGDVSAVMGVFTRVAPTNRRLFSIAGIGTIVFGFWLVLDDVRFEFETVWISVAIVAAVLALAIDLFYETPKASKILALVDANGAGDAEAAELAKKVSMFGHVRTLLLFVAFVMMIFQFGA
jgi:uncharacterized membrane protein